MTARALRWPVQRRQGHETGKVSAGPRWQGSGPQLTSLVDLHPWAFSIVYDGSLSCDGYLDSWWSRCVEWSTQWSSSLEIFALVVSMLVASQAYAITTHATQWLTYCCSLGYLPAPCFCAFNEILWFREGSPRTDDFHHISSRTRQFSMKHWKAGYWPNDDAVILYTICMYMYMYMYLPCSCILCLGSRLS